jgi:hypothetical protein
MKTNLIKIILIACLLPISIYHCSGPYNYCEINWYVLNKKDSTLIKSNLRIDCNFTPTSYNHEGPFYDTTSSGILSIFFTFDGKREVLINSNPNLNIIIKHNNKPIFDTSYIWNSFNFYVGKTKGGDDGNDIADDTIYINTNQTN